MGSAVLSCVIRVFALLVIGLGLLGCSSVRTHKAPQADLSRYQRFFVVHRLGDDHQIDVAIVTELRALGFEASAGPRTMMPQSTQAIVTYQDDWAWDFKSYMIQLNILVNDARNEQSLATGVYQQPSMITKTPPDVVRTVLGSIFKPRQR